MRYFIIIYRLPVDFWKRRDWYCYRTFFEIYFSFQVVNCLLVGLYYCEMVCATYKIFFSSLKVYNIYKNKRNRGDYLINLI